MRVELFLTGSGWLVVLFFVSVTVCVISLSLVMNTFSSLLRVDRNGVAPGGCEFYQLLFLIRHLR